MTESKKFDQLLAIFEGTPVEAILREMSDELGKEGAFTFISLVLTRTEQIAQLLMDQRNK